MRFWKLLTFATVVLASCTIVNAQESDGRKVVKQVPPPYPEMARKLNLTGVVKLEIIVSPNGTVKSTKVIGGNPVLAASAENTVKMWKYEPASDETTATIIVNFRAP